jgi:bifunctional non-homologous end joining protein LigD
MGVGPARSIAPLIPDGRNNAEIKVRGRTVRLTNLDKLFWPERGPQRGIVKRDLLAYYAALSPVLLPHLKDRAMVMKRYPNGAAGEFFFMKRTPAVHPAWLKTCPITHASGNVVDFPVVDDIAALLWVINLGCIDLNQWYARCDDVYRPDYLHFDLDPVPPAGFERVLETALRVRDELDALKIRSYPKTTGSRGIHIYVPIVRGPLQKLVWGFAKELSRRVAARHSELVTAEYRIAKRPPGRVLVDYNQNAWGRTLASVYSVRPKPLATVSMPVTWQEVERGFRMEEFRLDNAPARVAERGDLFQPLLAKTGRLRLEKFL